MVTKTGKTCESRRLSSIVQRVYARFMSEFMASMSKCNVSHAQRYNDCVRCMDETLKIVHNAFLDERESARISELKQDGLCNRSVGAQYRQHISKLVTRDLQVKELDLLLEERNAIDLFALRRLARINNWTKQE